VLPQLDDRQYRLVAGWLLGTLRLTGPYPVLALQAEAGSGKSTMTRQLRGIVDPSTVPIRSAPRDERDLAVSCAHNWVLALDNLSGLPAWLSDALCRVSTGGGIGGRELYTDAEEAAWDYTRPLLVNGIDDIATRGDMLDRSIVVTLRPLADDQRRTEADLWEEYERVRPAVLGALLDAVAEALRRVDAVRLDKLPRMADFALWVTAGETAWGWPEGTFVTAYTQARQEDVGAALDGDPVAQAVRTLLARREQWTGTGTELLTLLAGEATDAVRASQAWPKSPRSLKDRLTRLAPLLRRVGINYAENRTAKARLITVEVAGEVASSASFASHTGSEQVKRDDASSDANRRPQSVASHCVTQKTSYDADDANDAYPDSLSATQGAATAEEDEL